MARTPAAKPEPVKTEDRSTLPDGKPNMSPSGAPRSDVEPEAGVQPLKAAHLIIYGNGETAHPGQIFTPVSAKEREALAAGDDPAAVELTEDEQKLFGYENAGEFA